MLASSKILTSIATVVALLCLALPAAAATWTTEPVPAGPGALGPARLSFDAQGRALFLWDGVPTASQSRFTGMATRGPIGGWSAPGEPARRGLGQRPGACSTPPRACCS